MATFRKSAAVVMRRMRGRLRRLWKAIDEMDFEIAVTDRSVTRRAIELMSDPGLSPRDAFHAAHALDSACSVIVSSDPDYDRLDSIRRLAPPAGV
jgi:predicted nucleic acid-binding protein